MLQRENALRLERRRVDNYSRGRKTTATRTFYVFLCECGVEIKVRPERLNKHTGRCRACGAANRKDKRGVCSKCSEPHYAKGLCSRHHYEKFKPKYRASQRDWLKTLAGRYLALRTAARRSGLKFGITKEQHAELLSHPCRYCEKPLNSSGHGLDRKRWKIGYVFSNVVPCCAVCNRIKNKYLTHEEMLVAMRAVNEYRKSLIR